MAKLGLESGTDVRAYLHHALSLEGRRNIIPPTIPIPISIRLILRAVPILVVRPALLPSRGTAASRICWREPGQQQ